MTTIHLEVDDDDHLAITAAIAVWQRRNRDESGVRIQEKRHDTSGTRSMVQEAGS